MAWVPRTTERAWGESGGFAPETPVVAGIAKGDVVELVVDPEVATREPLPATQAGKSLPRAGRIGLRVKVFRDARGKPVLGEVSPQGAQPVGGGQIRMVGGVAAIFGAIHRVLLNHGADGWSKGFSPPCLRNSIVVNPGVKYRLADLPPEHSARSREQA